MSLSMGHFFSSLFPFTSVHMSTIDYILCNSFSEGNVAKYTIKGEVEIFLQDKINFGS